jgi:hypothetical protein
MRPDGFWRSSAIPVLVVLGVFTTLNAVWNAPALHEALLVAPYPLVVFMLGGSGLSLVFLRRALRTGWLTRHELGLGLDGWTAPKRLAALALVLVLSLGQLRLLQQQAPAETARPTWGDYCFNFFVCLSASLAELLVFLGLAFCWVERGLRHRGLGRLPATGIATVLTSVTFGLFHYSYPPFWYPLVVPLMGQMFCIVLFFLVTRNFWLTLAVHNAGAAIGFTRLQEVLHVQDFRTPPAIVVMALAFGLPFLYLHWLEWRGPAGSAAPAEKGL